MLEADRPKRYRKYLRLLAGLFLTLAVLAPALPARAADIEFYASPQEAKLGDKISVEGIGFDLSERYYLYLSSEKANLGNVIGLQVTRYKLMERNVRAEDRPGYPGQIKTQFEVPEALDDGENYEDVHGGEHYVYLALRTGKVIVAMAAFSMSHGEIQVSPEAAIVGSQIEVSGQGLRPDKTITIRYDGLEVDITGGDESTDANGDFTSAINVPEGPAEEYTITVIDEVGNRPQNVFRVIPQITLSPLSQEVDGMVDVSGTGFASRERVTVTLDGDDISPIPVSLHTTLMGNLGGSFIIPPYPRYTDGALATVTVRDESNNTASAEFNILPIPAAVSLSPAVSQLEPGYAGMELTVNGIWFQDDATVEISYGDVPVGTTEVRSDRNFSMSFSVPPSAPGAHDVTASDGSSSVTAVFYMEATKPTTPLVLLPETAAVTGSRPRFDWEDVTDPSSVSYLLQIAADSDFTTLILEKEGLGQSEYTLGEAESLEPSTNPYYWRVKSEDGTFSQSGWTVPRPFQVGGSTETTTGLPGWTRYLWIGLGVGLAAFLVVRMRRKAQE